jgi:hypothetical protein
MVANSETSILSRVIRPELQDLTSDAANAILRFNFTDADLRRMNELSQLAQEGSLAEDAREELENYNRVSHLLALLHSKARRSLSEMTRRG